MWSENTLLRDELRPIINGLNLTLLELSLYKHVHAENGSVSSYNRSQIEPIMQSPGGFDLVNNITLNGDINATLITCFTAFVPSPDWFTGFSAREMCVRNQTTDEFGWAVVDDEFGIIPYDGGIDGSERIQYETEPNIPPEIVRVKAEYLGNLGMFNVSNMNTSLSRRPEEKEEPTKCFPANAMVTRWDGSQVRMDQVRIGDVLGNAAGRRASAVYMFTHRNRDVYTRFVRLHFGRDRTLAASSGHFVYVNGGLKEMDQVSVGDSLQGDDGTMLRVWKVDEVWETGLYNPHTTSGELVVNGVRVSAYTRAVKSAAAHGILAVLRALHRCAAGRRWTGAMSRFFENERLRSRLARIVTFSSP